MFHTTLINLDPDGSRASSELGSQCVGELSAEELVALLHQFRALDPLQNVEADPEIVLERRRRKHIVRTAKGRLFFYDARNVLEQTLVLTPEEIVTEMESSPAVSRPRRLTATASDSAASPRYIPPASTAVSALRPRHRAALALAAACFAGYVAYAQNATTTKRRATGTTTAEEGVAAVAPRAPHVSLLRKLRSLPWTAVPS